VTDYPASVPDIIYMTSNGLAIYSGPEAAKSRLPSDRDLRVISTTQAQSLFGSSAESIDGVTVSHKGNLDFTRQPIHSRMILQWLVNDPRQL
jgi:hypothetical protein